MSLLATILSTVSWATPPPPALNSAAGASWRAGTAVVDLSAPSAETWNVLIELELQRADGTDSTWSVEVVVSSETLAEPIVLPRGVELKGAALLVGFARFSTADGRASPMMSLGGMPVVLDRVGALVPSPEPVTGATGIGLIHDANDAQPADEEGR